ncbi:unnamed protein product [Blepharisma stoltei]|uniref:Glutathione peroxidase n=1 Tax=Blepharisma stoltei TaxID=1481888 RepID=A0AAU9K6Q4_9CILI|nr:unnamed protein product [Blepharisma stoltei]
MGCTSSEPVQQSSIYEFTMNDIDGNPVSLAQYRGKVMIIVNVACGCGLTTKNYAQLNDLYSRYAEKALCILGFPCNQFFWQESGSHEEIKDHVRNFLNAKFDLFSKVEVNGKKACEMYKFLRQKSKLKGKRIGWNFGKFLIDKEGNIVNYYGPRTNPLSFEQDIVALLEKPSGQV